MEKKIHSLTIYVVLAISAIVVYTIVEFILSSITGISHDTLTTCVFAFFGTEIATSGLIKIFKLKESSDDDISG